MVVSIPNKSPHVKANTAQGLDDDKSAGTERCVKWRMS